MTWMMTRSGTAFDLLSPTADRIDFREICDALGQINRFTGHCRCPVSVALHSLTVARLVAAKAHERTVVAFERKHRRKPSLPATLDGHAVAWALLHDAKEAFIGDISTPMKGALAEAAAARAGEAAADLVRDALHALEGNIDAALLAASGLRWRSPNYPDAAARADVKEADLIALMMERRDFMARTRRPWGADLEALKLPREPLVWMSGPEAAEELYRLLCIHLPALWPRRR
jgi:5'-deoxynucleotidase YfbR-like HD superfamily hydrolase